MLRSRAWDSRKIRIIGTLTCQFVDYDVSISTGLLHALCTLFLLRFSTHNML